MIRQKQKSIEKIILIAFMLLPTLIISLNLDNDFWFLLNHGNYIVNNGFPIIEPFTIHSNFNFTIQQWLVDVIFYFIYTNFGKFGVIAVVYITALIIVYLIYKLCMLLSDNRFYLSVLITTYIYLLLCVWFMVSRPQIFTYTLLLVEFLFLEKYAQKKKWQYLIPLPFVSLALINCHSSMWWLSFAFILPYIIETIPINKFSLNVEPLNKAPIYIVAGLMIIMGFINPYGYKSVLYIFTSFGDDAINSSILEMSVPDVKWIDGMIFFITILFVVFVYVLNKDGKTKLRYILLTLGTLLLSLMAIKSIPYFLFGTVIPISYNLKNIGDKLVFKGDFKKTFGVTGIFVCLIYAVASFALVRDYDGTKDYPNTKDAVAYLAENTDAKDVVLYTSFFDGGYAEHNNFRVYIDARAEVFLKANNKQKDVFEEYISLQKGYIHYKEFLSRYNFTHILVDETDILNTYLSKDDNYSVFYEDEKSKIFIPINS